jgi:hypothetical protein
MLNSSLCFSEMPAQPAMFVAFLPRISWGSIIGDVMLGDGLF